MAYRTGLLAALTVLMLALGIGAPNPRSWSNVEAGSPAVSYWHRVLPATPIPATLRERIPPLSAQQTAQLAQWVDDAKADVSVGKDGVSVGTSHAGKGADVHVGKGGVAVGAGGPGKATDVHVGKGGVAVGARGPGKATDVHVGKGGVAVGARGPGKATDVHVGKGGVAVGARGPGKGTDVHVGKGGVAVGAGGPGKAADVHVGKGGVAVGTDGGGKGADVHVGKGGVSVGTKGGHKGANVHVGEGNPFDYVYAADERAIADPSASLFFLEKDLREGTKLTLHFARGERGPAFLPRRLADAIPFSSDELRVAFRALNVSPDSDPAAAMKKTVEECEAPAIDGESKHCATSLESMVDYTSSKLGTRVAVLETQVSKDSGRQDYTITAIAFRSKGGSKSVACHGEPYAYAVYYCHETEKTRAFRATLKAASDGSTVEGVAVCHEDTSKWNPHHVAFKVLNVKPGGAAVCHFIPHSHIVWIPSN